MPNEYKKILKCKHGEKWKKTPDIIYANLERLLEKMHSCQNNPEKSYTEKKSGAYIFQLPIVYILFLWFNKKQTWLLQRLYEKVLQRLKWACNENNWLW